MRERKPKKTTPPKNTITLAREDFLAGCKRFFVDGERLLSAIERAGLERMLADTSAKREVVLAEAFEPIPDSETFDAERYRRREAAWKNLDRLDKQYDAIFGQLYPSHLAPKPSAAAPTASTDTEGEAF